MFYKKLVYIGIALTLFNTFAVSENKITDLSNLDGNWHLRVMDGNEVRKARAILDFHSKNMKLEGFDGCNRISGKLQRTTGARFFSKITTTKMACRDNIHRYVSQRLHTAVQEGFSITEGKRYGVDGITLKSPHHELFFKRLGKDGWR